MLLIPTSAALHCQEKQPNSFDLKELGKLNSAKKSATKKQSPRRADTGSQTKNGGEDIGAEPSRLSLRQILRQMDSVHQRLSQMKTGKQTQQLQRQIVLELQRMARPGEKGQSSPSSRKKSANSKQLKSKTPSKGNPQNKAGAANAAANQAGRSGGGGQPPSPTQLMKTRNDAIGKVWGLLPKRIRSRMRSIPDGQYAAGYIDLVEDYFRRLARD